MVGYASHNPYLMYVMAVYTDIILVICRNNAHYVLAHSSALVGRQFYECFISALLFTLEYTAVIQAANRRVTSYFVWLM